MNKIKIIALNSLISLVVLLVFSFILDNGVSRLANQNTENVITEWLKTIFSFGKLGIWLIMILFFNIYRVYKK